MYIDVEEELNDRVNGGYLNDVSDNARYFDDKMREVRLERLRVLLGDDGIEQADKGGDKLYVASCWGHYGTR